MPEPRQITELAEQATQRFLSDQARNFIQCGVNLAAHSMPISEVARFLRDLAKQLEEFG